MHREIEYTTSLALELILCGLLLAVCAVCAMMGNKVYATKLEDKGKTSQMQDMAELFYYNNKIVSDSDAMELILTHTRDYEYWFCEPTDFNADHATKMNKTNERIFSTSAEKQREYWSEGNVRKIMNTVAPGTTKYNAYLIRRTSSSGIVGVKFVAVG